LRNLRIHQIHLRIASLIYPTSNEATLEFGSRIVFCFEDYNIERQTMSVNYKFNNRIILASRANVRHLHVCLLVATPPIPWNTALRTVAGLHEV